MFKVFVKGVAIAASPKGRKVIVSTVRLARSEQGKVVIAQARKVATGPEARRIASQAGLVARKVGEAARSPENQQRVKDAAKLLRERRGR